MTTNHTPGPWKFNPATKTIRSKENYWLATMDSWDGSINHTANARLIAAAPELLAALYKIHSNAAESIEWIRKVAGEAIAKAENNI